MHIFYTKTYNLSGANAEKQQITETVARKLGYQELSFFRFDDSTDTDTELHMRMEAITAPLQAGSVVLFQYPSMVSLRYDHFALEHIRRNPDTKIILYVQDLGSVIAPETYGSLADEINFFNQGDFLILPSPTMQAELSAQGLRKIPFLCQEIWEYPYEVQRSSVRITACESNISGNISLDSFYQLTTSGIAAVMNADSRYERQSNPLAAGFCLCSGIPVFAPAGSRLHDFIMKYDLGFPVDNETTVEDVLAKLTEDEIAAVIQRIQKLQPLINTGFFTEHLLETAVFQAVTQKL